MTLINFINNISIIKRYSTHTIRSMESDIKQFSIFAEEKFNITDLSKINTQIIRAWLSKLVSENYANSSINRKLSSLKSFYNYLKKDEVIDKNPLLAIKSLKKPNRLVHFINYANLESIENKASITDFVQNRNNLIIELLYTTGLRLSEIINLQIDDINFSGNYIRVLGKGKKERIIPLIPYTVKLLENHIIIRDKAIEANCNNLIITETGKKSYPMLIQRIVNNELTKKGIKGKKSPHVLRHTFATHLLNEGADINIIKELLGHSNLSATEIYTHVSINKLKNIYKQTHPRS